jgi:hypothetical protein
MTPSPSVPEYTLSFSFLQGLIGLGPGVYLVTCSWNFLGYSLLVLTGLSALIISLPDNIWRFSLRGLILTIAGFSGFCALRICFGQPS